MSNSELVLPFRPRYIPPHKQLQHSQSKMSNLGQRSEVSQSSAREIDDPPSPSTITSSATLSNIEFERLSIRATSPVSLSFSSVFQPPHSLRFFHSSRRIKRHSPRSERLNKANRAAIFAIKSIKSIKRKQQEQRSNLEMASNQYSYPPPPPPPPSTNTQGGPPAGYQQYQQPPYGQQQPARGGGGARGGRGRGGFNQGGHGEFQNSQYPPHAGGYNGPPAPVGGYGQQGGQYAGPPAPASGYPPPQQWRGNEPQLQQQHHQVQHQQPPHPAPLSVQNYHPNYAPQVYQPNGPQQQPQYGPQQPAPYPQGPYGPPAPMPPQPQQQWQAGPGPQSQPPFNNGNRGGRGGRGGGGAGRGGFEAPLMGPPIRMGFDSDRSAAPMTQAGNGFSPPPYAVPQHGAPVPFSAPAYPPQNQYQPYPSQNAFPPRGGRQSLEPNPFQSNGSNRGRGGMQNRGNKREQFGDRARHRGQKHPGAGHNKSFSQGAVTDQPQKPAADAGAKSGEKRKKKKKRKTNTLGLTPGTEEYQESEDEDDADEEAKLAAAALGSTMSEEPSDLAAWLEERRKKWPTAARRSEKEAELAARRTAAAEQSARDKAKAKDALDASKIKTEPETKIEKQKRKAEKLRRQLERAEQKVKEAMKAGTKRKREAGDSGDEDNDDASTAAAAAARVKSENDGDIDALIAAATGAASSSSDSDSEYTSASDSDSDSGPDAAPSKRAAPIVVAAPKKPILQRHCKYFSTGGTCGKKGKCRFVHDQGVREAAIREKEMNGGVMTLAQRLTQNDKEKDELMVLKSIKYLHEKGMLDEPDGV
ncbi:hypothetical protein V500_08796 [Pseudogymnoascus sp. VKM F-4518 (FW-2643)]|nr:hypothetical protein V500_08796 [Pseudogymnoascus sp. VKM F-4518 (FW-2643)]